jgi:AcrR family transcriptional regulator
MTSTLRYANDPVTARGRATRQRIVDAACDLVYARGVAAVNLDDVLDATGTSKSQLYHYFADKSDLVHAVVVHQGERVLELQRPVLEAVDGWAALRRWRTFVVGIVKGRRGRGGCPIGSLSSELAELDEGARLELAGVFDRWQQLLADALHRMIESGAIRRDADADQLALATMASLQGGLLLAKTRRSTKPLEVALDAAIAYLETAAAPTPRRRRTPR